ADRVRAVGRRGIDQRETGPAHELIVAPCPFDPLRISELRLVDQVRQLISQVRPAHLPHPLVDLRLAQIGRPHHPAGDDPRLQHPGRPEPPGQIAVLPTRLDDLLHVPEPHAPDRGPRRPPRINRGDLRIPRRLKRGDGGGEVHVTSGRRLWVLSFESERSEPRRATFPTTINQPPTTVP